MMWEAMLAALALLLLFSFENAAGTEPPDEELLAQGYETVHQYRQRLGIEYNYTTQWITPEICRKLDPEECKALDEAFERGVLSNRKIMDEHKRRRLQQGITSSNMRVLVLLVQFSNHGERPLVPPDDVETIFNSQEIDEELIPTGSVSKWFQVNSYGSFDITADVVPWQMDPESEQYYASFGDRGRHPELIKTMEPILEMLDESDFDFTPYDQDGDFILDLTVMLHSGYSGTFGGVDCETGAISDNRIAAHATTAVGRSDWRSQQGHQLGSYAVASAYRGVCGALPARIGVIVHEMIHPFGIPDLYDVQGAYTPGLGNIGGIDRFGIMANPRGQMNSLARPGHASAWTKTQLWVDPIVISSDGTYNARASESHPDIYRIDFGFAPFEYLLLEMRTPCPGDFDENFWEPGGIVIYHIDENNMEVAGRGNSPRGGPFQDDWPINGLHYPVAVLQRDGLYELEQSLNGGHNNDYYYLPEHELGPGNGEPIADTANYPNTDSYAFGMVSVTGLTINNFVAQPDKSMNFDVLGFPTEQPSSSPSTSPSVATTNATTPSPSVVPSAPPTEATPEPSTRPTSLNDTLAPSPFQSSGPTELPSDQPSQDATNEPGTPQPTSIIPDLPPSPSSKKSSKSSSSSKKSSKSSSNSSKKSKKSSSSKSKSNAKLPAPRDDDDDDEMPPIFISRESKKSSKSGKSSSYDTIVLPVSGDTTSEDIFSPIDKSMDSTDWEYYYRSSSKSSKSKSGTSSRGKSSGKGSSSLDLTPSEEIYDRNPIEAEHTDSSLLKQRVSGTGTSRKKKQQRKRTRSEDGGIASWRRDRRNLQTPMTAERIRRGEMI